MPSSAVTYGSVRTSKDLPSTFTYGSSCSYLMPARSLPLYVSRISYSSFNTLSARDLDSMNLYPLDNTFMYSKLGLTQRATLASKVQGVVVQTKKYVSSSFILNGTITVLTLSSWYPCDTSLADSSVPHLGQYGNTLLPWYIKFLSAICFSNHHSDSMYSLLQVI